MAKRFITSFLRDEPSYPDEMLSIIRKGLPATANPKRIIILGAGMAGLVAGSLLKSAGHQVVILEGNDRVGGRVYTLREPFTRGNYLDAGAMRIPNTQPLVLEYIEKFKLPVNEFINSTPNDLLYVNNVLTRKKAYEEDPGILQFPVQEAYENQTAFAIFTEAVEPFFELYQSATPAERKKLREKYDQYSFETFLKNNPFGRSLNTEEIRFIQVLLGIEGFPELSFSDIVTDIVTNLYSADLKYFEIKGGNDRLPWSFMPQLERNIFFHHLVERIKQYSDGVIVSGINPLTGQKQEVRGDYVITTIPFSIFQFVRVEPYESMSFYKREAIAELNYVASTKIGLEFKHKFWEKEKLFGGSLTTDLPTQFAYYPSHDIGVPGPGVMLGSYSWGDNTALWDALPEGRRIYEALKILSYVHGPVVFEQFLNGTSFSWGQNQFSGGCFTLFKPYQYTEFDEVIKKPEGRIHFAGEHTSSFHGWIEGAIESGIRAAAEVNSLTLEE
ncbi:flavin monoamine oxidase family protein [Bacillus sp. Marseille-Q3570]|uniref:flavin monoamine oxidase family protein n=1 Tax=Bacillus sp. Marseille-Q3570 TaxID=2963522 RepID=UPI0021B822DE|nr:flavin monoamine oxidase family protein [Bacillus sp. Marseille-Q3570]